MILNDPSFPRPSRLTNEVPIPRTAIFFLATAENISADAVPAFTFFVGKLKLIPHETDSITFF
jgi:hypothetical protein